MRGFAGKPRLIPSNESSGHLDRGLTVGAAILVSIKITPADPSIVSGTTEPFMATGSFSDHRAGAVRATRFPFRERRQPTEIPCGSSCATDSHTTRGNGLLGAAVELYNLAEGRLMPSTSAFAKLGRELMMNVRAILFAAMVIALSPFAACADDVPPKSPDQELPGLITRLTLFGERADFSHDGRRILFVEKTFGDAYEIDLATKQPRLLTGHYKHLGYTRALYLCNGDILLSGPERFDPKDPGPSRVQCFLYVLGKDLTRPPVPLRTKCSEGPAVSRQRMHIAWTQVAEQYPDEMPRHSSRIYEADIMFEGGVPKAANRRLVVDSRSLPFRCTLECQNFRPPDERELTFSAYGYNGTDVCGIDLETKKVVNYSDAPDQYDEPEGILPDGRWTLVESDRECRTGRGPGHVDIWKLSLDGKRRWERLTYFNTYPGYKSSNPVVSDDGRFMAFQMARSSDPAGVGYGIFLYELAKAVRND
jgi:hypothetical protein